MFPGHQDGLESFIAGPCKPGSKTDRIYFLPGEVQKSKSPEAVNLETFEKDKFVETQYFSKSKDLREGFFFKK